jgi:hypothetical protein
VGGGYPSDILAQAPLKWLMDKAAIHGLRFVVEFEQDASDPKASVSDSYAGFLPWYLRLFSRRYYRPIGLESDVGTVRTTSRINETIDASVFARWRDNSDYRPPNLDKWAKQHKLDPADIEHAVIASDPRVAVP